MKAVCPDAMACCVKPFRGHPRNGLLPAAVRSRVCSVLEMPKYRVNKISFKNKYLCVIPAYAALRSQIATWHAGCADVAEKLAPERVERQLKDKGLGKKK